MKEPFVSIHKSVYVIKEWQDRSPGLVAGFTTKEGGMSGAVFKSLNMGFHVGDCVEHVCENRQLLSKTLDFPVSSWVGAVQTHEDRIVTVGEKDKGKGALDYQTSFEATDGFFTDEKGILLTLCYADCVPLYFFSNKFNRIGTAHAGWKGTVSGIGLKMVKKWEEEGIPLQEIEVVIGPSICGDCYIVDDYVIDKARQWEESNNALFYAPVDGRKSNYHLSLQQLNKLILMKAGIPQENIQMTHYCTSCHSEFFSHRRDLGKTGRMMGFIGWKEK
ncbi:peptidoglycan editing factor PgeF [Bacillus sp. REN10]|uniref:peptidoglycan editing factor PgeF n=1 Tax=Bacillus sp. REN10 TaxID=2782541 RepID=UPI00193B8217|nr:peptidoglycan editing factor PgeF [Bacillus sp. REN10]